jgi:hypothetical protein
VTESTEQLKVVETDASVNEHVEFESSEAVATEEMPLASSALQEEAQSNYNLEKSLALFATEIDVLHEEMVYLDAVSDSESVVADKNDFKKALVSEDRVMLMSQTERLLESPPPEEESKFFFVNAE